MSDILDLMANEAELLEINQNNDPLEGLKKSLMND